MEIADLKAADAALAEATWQDARALGAVRLLVLPASAPQVTREYQRLARRVPMARRDADGALPADAEDSIERDVHARIALQGWDGITSDGAPFEFSRERAVEMMRSDLFAQAVAGATMQAAIARADVLAALVKNSEPPLDG